MLPIPSHSQMGHIHVIIQHGRSSIQVIRTTSTLCFKRPPCLQKDSEMLRWSIYAVVELELNTYTTSESYCEGINKTLESENSTAAKSINSYFSKGECRSRWEWSIDKKGQTNGSIVRIWEQLMDLRHSCKEWLRQKHFTDLYSTRLCWRDIRNLSWKRCFSEPNTC